MGLFDRNKPIWMKGGLSCLEALKYVKSCENQDELAKIVLEGKLIEYKSEALRKIKDKNALIDLAGKIDTKYMDGSLLRVEALIYAQDEDALKRIIENTDKNYEIEAAIPGISDEDFIFKTAMKYTKSWDICAKCASRLTNQKYLSELGCQNNTFANVEIAKKTNDIELLKYYLSVYSDKPATPGQYYPLVNAENEVYSIAKKRLKELEKSSE